MAQQPGSGTSINPGSSPVLDEDLIAQTKRVALASIGTRAWTVLSGAARTPHARAECQEAKSRVWVGGDASRGRRDAMRMYCEEHRLVMVTSSQAKSKSS